MPLHLPTKINGHEILRASFPYWVHFAIEAMLSRTKNQIICMYFDSGHANYMISAQFISQAHFPEKKFRLRLSICNYMPQQIIYPQVPKCSYLAFKRFRVD